MLIYIATWKQGREVQLDNIISYNHSMQEALKQAKEHCEANNVFAYVYRVVIKCQNKKDVCSILAGKAEFKEWQTLYCCYMNDGEVSTTRYRLA